MRRRQSEDVRSNHPVHTADATRQNSFVESRLGCELGLKCSRYGAICVWSSVRLQHLSIVARVGGTQDAERDRVSPLELDVQHHDHDHHCDHYDQHGGRHGGGLVMHDGSVERCTQRCLTYWRRRRRRRRWISPTRMVTAWIFSWTTVFQYLNQAFRRNLPPNRRTSQKVRGYNLQMFCTVH